MELWQSWLLRQWTDRVGHLTLTIDATLAYNQINIYVSKPKLQKSIYNFRVFNDGHKKELTFDWSTLVLIL